MPCFTLPIHASPFRLLFLPSSFLLHSPRRLFGVTTLYCKPFANTVTVLSEPMADQSPAD
ncbi:hypothetical protein Godav_027593 [Gossypium davidsonii]|uniref:Uncharacterized protein n=2 Tax=Gossypium TaxID=3633 RepID=A0A7J8RWE9_GOSDV|nr:hypothetical protein [Gossypium davidsonii]MBA0653562.1 hypothetical protein [Gossypium klotzschianum]